MGYLNTLGCFAGERFICLLLIGMNLFCCSVIVDRNNMVLQNVEANTIKLNENVYGIVQNA